MPFHVALPTYGYLAAFDANNKLVGLSAEGPDRGWPNDTTIRAVRSDAVQIVGLVRDCIDHPPPWMQGIMWYRLPVDGDRLNWRFQTLKAVMAGHAPKSCLTVTTTRSDPGVSDIAISNGGDNDHAALFDVIVSCGPRSRILAADAVAGFMRVDSTPKTLRLRPTGDSACAIRPQKTRTIGWIRCDNDTDVETHVEPCTK